MKIIDLLARKHRVPMEHRVPTIAFLGDSVTRGCFELYMLEENQLGNVCDESAAYPSCVKTILRTLFPWAPINIVDAGVAGDNAAGGVKRLERDVLSYAPDLTVVCFGLNDSCFGLDKLDDYKEALDKIFSRLKEAGSEIIFMTPNMMNTRVCYNIEPEFTKANAASAMKIQNEGVFDRYLEEAKALCQIHNVAICDCYGKWKKLYESGVDTTELLSNKINHPIRAMHWMFAGMLVDTMFEK